MLIFVFFSSIYFFKFKDLPYVNIIFRQDARSNHHRRQVPPLLLQPYICGEFTYVLNWDVKFVCVFLFST